MPKYILYGPLEPFGKDLNMRPRTGLQDIHLPT